MAGMTNKQCTEIDNRLDAYCDSKRQLRTA